MGWVAGIILGLVLLAATSGPVDPAAVVPASTTVANAGGGHCGYGPNDSDVRGVIRATASTEPHC